MEIALAAAVAGFFGLVYSLANFVRSAREYGQESNPDAIGPKIHQLRLKIDGRVHVINLDQLDREDPRVIERAIEDVQKTKQLAACA